MTQTDEAPCSADCHLARGCRLKSIKVGAVFLSAGVLTEDERELAFAAVPEMEALRLNRNIALNLIDGKALTTIDGIAGCGGAKSQSSRPRRTFAVLQRLAAT